MTTTTTPPHPPIPTLTFYDIQMRPPLAETACSPNPTKSRLALNFKAVPYKTQWVALPSIADLRQSLHIPAGRKFADGSDFYTLPILHDPATDTFVGDSLDIAIYLDRTYPSEGAALFPSTPPRLDFEYDDKFGILVPLSNASEVAKGERYLAYAEFNRHVDAAFTMHTMLCVERMPFHPDTEKISKAEFCRRAGKKSWEEFATTSEMRKGLLASLQGTLGDLAKLFGRDTDGPFIMGARVCYADFIVGGWLRMLRVCLPADEWEEIRGWHGGVFGTLYEALEMYLTIE